MRIPQPPRPQPMSSGSSKVGQASARLQRSEVCEVSRVARWGQAAGSSCKHGPGSRGFRHLPELGGGTQWSRGRVAGQTALHKVSGGATQKQARESIVRLQTFGNLQRVRVSGPERVNADGSINPRGLVYRDVCVQAEGIGDRYHMGGVRVCQGRRFL